MREQKYREDKDRHPFAWNPDYGWQVLRRCPRYHDAVKDFLASAKDRKDKQALSAYKFYSRDVKGKGRETGSRFGKRFNRKTILQFQMPNQRFPQIRRAAYGPALKVDTSTKHYLNFFSWYGDIIAFPINPTVELPAVDVLSSLWNLYSFKLSSFELPIDHSESLKEVNLTLNMNYKPEVIAEDVKQFILSILTDDYSIQSNPRWRPNEFEHYIKVFDERYSDPKKKIGYLKIAEKVAPQDVVQNGERAMIDWARGKLKYMESHLIPIFDKPKPKRKTFRGY